MVSQPLPYYMGRFISPAYEPAVELWSNTNAMEIPSMYSPSLVLNLSMLLILISEFKFERFRTSEGLYVDGICIRVAQFQEILPKPCSPGFLGLYFMQIVTSIFSEFLKFFLDLPHVLRNISWQLYGTICAFQKSPRKPSELISIFPTVSTEVVSPKGISSGGFLKIF